MELVPTAFEGNRRYGEAGNQTFNSESSSQAKDWRGWGKTDASRLQAQIAKASRLFLAIT